LAKNQLAARTRASIKVYQTWGDVEMGRPRIDFPQEMVAEFCGRHRIRKLALFGSVLREDFRPTSDVDILVEFEPGCTPGILRIAGMELELSALLGRKVDLRTAAELSRYFRDDVVRESDVQYSQR
jgi:predicted nucleotidyltransferase